MPPNIRVLIVEDSATIRMMLSDLIDISPGMEVVDAVGTAEEALEHLPDARPDVIALDQTLPGISGTAMLERLADTGVTSKVVMISADARINAPLCAEAFERGALACFNKARLAEEGEDLVRLLGLAAFGRVPPVGHRGLGTILPRPRVDFV